MSTKKQFFSDVRQTAKNEERCSTKKQSFSQKRTGFLSGISLYFQPFVVRYCFSMWQPPIMLPRKYARDATKSSRYNMFLTFRNDVCMMGLNPNVSLARAGAVAQYVSGIVIFCGGQSHQNPAHKDCLYYSPLGDVWHQFTTMKKVGD